MKKISLYIAALLSMLTLCTSCDKEADKAKVETVSTDYDGEIIAGLYAPDYITEIENYIYYSGKGEHVYLATDTLRDDIVHMDFSSSSEASISMKDLSAMNFQIQFLEDDLESVRDIYDEGKLAEVYYIIRALYAVGKISDVEFTNFAQKMYIITDAIDLGGIQTKPLMMHETGSMLTTYDAEQHSIYEKVYLDTFTFTRKTNITDALQYIEDNFKNVLAASDLAKIQTISKGVKLSGTVTDATGWAGISYSNYRPSIDLSLTNATGLLDNIAIALFGYKKDDSSNLILDKQGNPIPKDMWFTIDYNGNIWNQLNVTKKEN